MAQQPLYLGARDTRDTEKSGFAILSSTPMYVSAGSQVGLGVPYCY